MKKYKMRKDLTVIETNYTRESISLLRKKMLKKKQVFIVTQRWLVMSYRCKKSLWGSPGTGIRLHRSCRVPPWGLYRQTSKSEVAIQEGVGRREVSLDWVKSPGSSLWLSHLLAVGSRVCQMASWACFLTSVWVKPHSRNLPSSSNLFQHLLSLVQPIYLWATGSSFLLS